MVWESYDGSFKKFEILTYGLHMRVQQWRSSAPWILMADYAAPQVAWRQVLWDDLVEMAGFFGDLGS